MFCSVISHLELEIEFDVIMGSEFKQHRWNDDDWEAAERECDIQIVEISHKLSVIIIDEEQDITRDIETETYLVRRIAIDKKIPFIVIIELYRNCSTIHKAEPEEDENLSKEKIKILERRKKLK
jgi:hypothetical protein